MIIIKTLQSAGLKEQEGRSTLGDACRPGPMFWSPELDRSSGPSGLEPSMAATSTWLFLAAPLDPSLILGSQILQLQDLEKERE